MKSHFSGQTYGKNWPIKEKHCSQVRL